MKSPTALVSAASVLCLVMLAGCSSREGRPGGGDAGTPDAGVEEDAGRVIDAGADAGGADSGAEPDAGADAGAADAGRDAGADAGTADAGRDAGPPAGDCGDLGKTCSGAGSCPAGYACDDFRGVCLPSERPICGGFVGATCDTAEYPSCRYLTSADYGPCLTPAEAECACRELTHLFACP